MGELGSEYNRSSETGRNWQFAFYGATCAVKQGNGWVNRTALQGYVVVGHAHVLAVEGEGKTSLGHIQEDSQNSFFLESFPVLRS